MKHDYQHAALPPFAALVEALVPAIENADGLEPSAQLVVIHQLLAQAHASALRLPPTSVLFDDADEVSEDEEAEAEKRADARPKLPSARLDDLAVYLGLRRYYREVFDPYGEESEGEGCGDLLDDFQDIHADLSRGLFHWREGNGGLALWEWRFNFECHWGEHATSALRALFALCAWHGFPWPSESGSEKP